MTNGPGLSRASRFLLYGAAFVVLVAGVRTAESILVPFLLAVMLAVICATPLGWLQRKGLPTWLSVLLIVLMLLGIGTMTGTLIGTSLIDFTRSLPGYQVLMEREVTKFVAWLSTHGFEVSGQLLAESFNPGEILPIVGRIFTEVGDVLGKIALILIITVFILLEISGFSAKVRSAFPNADRHMRPIAEINDNVRRYLALKTLISLATGVLVAVWLRIVGVDYALLWGLLAFLLNYIPSIGSFIAAIPAVMLAFLQLGPGDGIITAIGYLLINTVIGNFIEPRVMGEGMGLSTLVVFLSLIFWGWVLGPVGMLLSVPLTMIMKIALEGSDETRWIAVLLGSKPADAVVGGPGDDPAEWVGT
jgi:predicted PurR-regulated permease PerM